MQQEFESRDDAKEWIIKNQFGRRNITKWDRCMLGLSLEDAFREKAKEKLKTNIGNMDLMVELSKEPLTNWSNPLLTVDTKKEVNTRAEVAKLALSFPHRRDLVVLYQFIEGWSNDAVKFFITHPEIALKDASDTFHVYTLPFIHRYPGKTSLFHYYAG